MSPTPNGPSDTLPGGPAPASTATGRLIDLSGAAPVWPDEARWLWARCSAPVQNLDGLHTPRSLGEPQLRSALGATLGLPDPWVTPGVRVVAGAVAGCGRRIVTEVPTFLGVVDCLRAWGADVVLAGSVEEMVGTARPAPEHTLWITSPARNPDGWSLDADRAALLAEFVADGGLLVQNETYRLTTPEPRRVPGALLVGTLHKVAGGWTRVGWAHGPCPPPVRAMLRHAGPPTAWQLVWARFVREGGLDLLVRSARRAVAEADEVRVALGAAGCGPSLLVRAPGQDVHGLLQGLDVTAGAGPAFAAAADTARLMFSAGTPDGTGRRVLERLDTLPALYAVAVG
jgi:DNA-binding transcriptional MocR family regulator